MSFAKSVSLCWTGFDLARLCCRCRMPDESMYIETKVFYLHFLQLTEIIRISLFSSQSAAKAHANQTTVSVPRMSRVFLFFFFLHKAWKSVFLARRRRLVFNRRRYVTDYYWKLWGELIIACRWWCTCHIYMSKATYTCNICVYVCM